MSESTIHVHVIRGQNVPLRREFLQQYKQFLNNKGNYRQQNQVARQQAGVTGFRQGDENIEDRGKAMDFQDKHDVYKTAMVESYVEIKVQFSDGRTIIDRTWCDEGKDPNWNEIKSFLFKPINSEKFTKQQLYDD